MWGAQDDNAFTQHRIHAAGLTALGPKGHFRGSGFSDNP